MGFYCIVWGTKRRTMVVVVMVVMGFGGGVQGQRAAMTRVRGGRLPHGQIASQKTGWVSRGVGGVPREETPTGLGRKLFIVELFLRGRGPRLIGGVSIDAELQL